MGLLEKGDAELFEAVSKSLRQVGGSLVLVGPEADWARDLEKRFENIYILGSRHPDLIPAYLAHADLGLMLYDRNRQNVYKGQNPLKLYEYAAAGLPILSTPHDEYRWLDPPVITVESPEDIPAAMDVAIRERSDLRRAAHEFADRYSWRSCFLRAGKKIFNRRM